MYSVWPWNVIPSAQMVSLQTGAVTSAQASFALMSLSAVFKYAREACAPKDVGRPIDNFFLERIWQSTKETFAIPLRSYRRKTISSPTTVKRMSFRDEKRVSALAVTSGPIPKGSPIVIAIFLTLDFNIGLLF